MHNSWDKNDPKDAQVILHLLRTGLAQTWHDPLVNGINDAQELSKTHHQVTGALFEQILTQLRAKQTHSPNRFLVHLYFGPRLIFAVTSSFP